MVSLQFSTGSENVSAWVLSILLVTLIVYAVLRSFIYSNFRSPYRNLRKPPLKGAWSFVVGHLPELQKGGASECQLRWSKEYGRLVVYRGLFCQERLFTTDPAALRHILISKPYLYPKPAAIQSALQNFVGNGLLTAEGDVHRRQKRVVGKAFTASAVKQYCPLIHRSASKLVSTLKEKVGGNVDVLHWCSRTTLDVIGEVTLGQELKSMDKKKDGDVVADSFTSELFQGRVPFCTHMRKIVTQFWAVLFISPDMINEINHMSLFERVLLHFDHLPIFDPFRPLPTRINKTAGKCRAVCEAVANKLMNKVTVDEVEESDSLVTSLFKSSKRPSDEQERKEDVLQNSEIVGQITTALLAGHETTSTALSWSLMALSQDGDLQARLRDEINSSVGVDLEDMTPEDIDALALLDNVTSEVLRLYSPVHSTNREATEDDVVPLSRPIMDKNDQPVHNLIIRKGQAVIIQIAAYNRSEDVWGPDALQFNPARWNNLPKTVTDSNIPNHHLSFIAGARTCVGYRLANLEFKIILAHLITKLSFAIDPTQNNMTAKEVVVARPLVAGEEEMGSRMPLTVSALL
ncbi:hypothetical protein CBS101457_001327 [Exobasidium rhododendri]|nr:hypothetical protein CBS101457_001327 [Exobasidium rhododendri]